MQPGTTVSRRPAVFLDRDGTVTVPLSRGTYVVEPANLRLVSGAAAAIARLNEAGTDAVVVTNQRWISRPNGSVSTYLRVHKRLCFLLAEQGARLDGHYYCPHPMWSCGCRKPAAGMLLAAARLGGYDLSTSALIGDSDVDLRASRTAGVTAIRIGAGYVSPNKTWDYAAVDLSSAVDTALELIASGRSR
ncbi:MAG: D-glycero-alpha-D-manno-heptose-1,7-bisphosphate 7-phosphatase [Mycobacteriales bacterium]